MIEQIEKKAKSLLELRKEVASRHKRLCEASVGEEAKKIAFEMMHFMEDRQWVKVSDVLEQLEQLRDFDFWQWLKTTYPDYNEDNLSDFKEMLQNFVKKELLARPGSNPVRRAHLE